MKTENKRKIDFLIYYDKNTVKFKSSIPFIKKLYKQIDCVVINFVLTSALANIFMNWLIDKKSRTFFTNFIDT